uniref:sulfotransferase 2A1-like isoform X2 n=1 Tax=Ictidomys tridecemlineatus TaxID=43179 RepID=UPI00038C2FF6|nr:sulfotransferase 2A1-like isoform X2 [Ictidomys tridecemlineatus]
MTDGYLWFEGLPFPVLNYSYEVLKEACAQFVIKDEDTVLVTYPKSGTHWLVEILSLIHSNGDTKWIRSVPLWDRSPWLETNGGYKRINKREGPRLMSSHLPFHLFPKSLFTSKAKVIYIMRNPKDVLVSGYYQWNMTKLCKKSESLEQYFQWFMQGNGICGDWKNHLTVAQAEAFDKVYQEKMAGFPKELFPWE